jgi:hypothetical protein
MVRIRPSDTPQQVHCLLLEKWGISLFKFAQVFAVSPLDLILQKNSYPFSGKEIREIKRLTNKMRADLLKSGRQMRRMTKILWDVPEEGLSDKELIKEMHLEEFIDKYIHRFEVAIRYLERTSFQGGRGVGINKKSIIAVGWGYLVSQERRRIDWKLLSELYEWFWYRVCRHKYYGDLRPVPGLEEYLRHQYNVHRWAGGAFDYLCANLKISKEEEVLPFLTNLYVQRTVGGKEEYFKDKLPMSEAKLKKLFLNLNIESSLARTDGLTLFSEDQSLADSCFLFFFIWLAKSAGTPNMPLLTPDSLSVGIHLEGADDPFANTQIGDYMGIALKYFLDHGINLSELPPLIIFPDKACFSPCP